MATNRVLNANIQTLQQDIEVNLASGFIYTFSPIAKVELLQNGHYLITITDKNGTTTAEIPVLSESNLELLLDNYFMDNITIFNGGDASTEYI